MDGNNLGDTAMKPTKTDTITLSRTGAVTRFDISGEMTASSESLMNDAYKSAVRNETKKILFNFNGCDHITSAGIGIFIHILVQAIKRNQQIGITGITKHFKKIFKMLGITKIAMIHDNIHAAVDALNSAR
jgi:anti-anti-sigma factor